MLDECCNDELVEAEVNTQQKHRVNCSFYLKIGACRHGDKCSRLHTLPTSSKTILLKNFCHLGGIVQQDHSKEREQREFEKFFREVYLEIDEEYGEIEAMNVCDNAGEHMLGNVYVKFVHESNANNAVKALNNRWFDGKPIHCELSPVSNFRDACCRQYANGECSRGAFCNFIHVKKISPSLKRKLEKESGKVRRRKSVKLRKLSECSCKKIDGSLPKKYQDVCSSDESSWSDCGPSSSRNHRSLTPFAFRADRYTSDVSESDAETDPEFEAHKQLLISIRITRDFVNSLLLQSHCNCLLQKGRILMTISITVAGVTDTLRPEHEKTTLDMPREEFFFKHWNNFEEIACRNKNTSLGEKIAILTPHIDIIHVIVVTFMNVKISVMRRHAPSSSTCLVLQYAMKDSGPVTGRDFVTTRINRHVDGDIIEAARSYNTDEVDDTRRK
ncbi:unnamed protein product [Litomosoides sigmodontis]|uniref:C3H1-type domain-containing protein n=1 Tax=Litomosoides sigmodontis TaxID=42156 RepID=A0A3P6T498_LITSI|nr:unnamed protein product [Litomosoides sigmodontis]